MVAVLAMVALASEEKIDPSVVDLMLADTELRGYYAMFGSRLAERGEDVQALRLFERYEPKRNKHLYDLLLHDRDAERLAKLSVRSYPELSIATQELIYRPNEESIAKAVAAMNAAGARGELDDRRWADQGIRANEAPVIALCFELANSPDKTLAARVFKSYVDPETFGGGTQAGLYLAFTAQSDADRAVFIPRGLNTVSTRDLVLYGALIESDLFLDGAADALIKRPRPEIGEGLLQVLPRQICEIVARLFDKGQQEAAGAIVEKYRSEIVEVVAKGAMDGRIARALVRLGRQDVFIAAAERSLASIEDPVKAPPVTQSRIARLLAFGGDDAKAAKIIEGIPMFSRGREDSLPDLAAARFAALGQYDAAARSLEDAPGDRIYEIVRLRLEQIELDGTGANQKETASGLVTWMLANDAESYWSSVDDTLLRLGMKSELKALLDSYEELLSSGNPQSTRALRDYIAVGGLAEAAKIVELNPFSVGGIVAALDRWDEQLHGELAIALSAIGEPALKLALDSEAPQDQSYVSYCELLIKLLVRFQSEAKLANLVFARLETAVSHARPEQRLAIRFAAVSLIVPDSGPIVMDLPTQRRVSALLMREF